MNWSMKHHPFQPSFPFFFLSLFTFFHSQCAIWHFPSRPVRGRIRLTVSYFPEHFPTFLLPSRGERWKIRSNRSCIFRLNVRGERERERERERGNRICSNLFNWVCSPDGARRVINSGFQMKPEVETVRGEPCWKDALSEKYKETRRSEKASVEKKNE